MRFLFLLVPVGCVKRYDLDIDVTPIPSGIYTTRPLPYQYTEAGFIEAEGWTLPLAMEATVNAARTQLDSDAAVDVRWTIHSVTVPIAQCSEILVCPPALSDASTATVNVYKVQGIAVRWIQEPAGE